MCGFFAAKNVEMTFRLEETLDERLGFRGPDYQSGLVSHAGWYLYHARLKIISDTTESNQPYYAGDGAVLLFNGEILNFESLQQTYFGGVSSASDTIVLARLLEIDDFDLDELEGFFAFVRIDQNGQLTHAARDAFGVKPLHYFNDGTKQIFSSEASAISDVLGLKYNKGAMEEYKVFRYPIFSESYFDNIRQVVPGTCLCRGQYFDAHGEMLSAEKAGPKDTFADVEKIVAESVRQRLIADFPVAVLFSGGIDSNLVRAFVPSSTKFLTGGLVEPSFDTKFANSEIEQGLDVEILQVDDAKFLERWTQMVALRKEPLSVPNEVIISFLGERWATLGGKILLSGEGADEFFGGYDRIFSWAGGIEFLDAREFLKRYAYVALEDIPEWIIEATKSYFAGVSNLSPFNMVRLFFVQKHMPVLFRRLDFSLMFSGIEGREPLASKALFRAAIQFDYHACMADGLGKIPLREVAQRLYSEEFAFREKVGFPIDVKKIVTGEEAKNPKDIYSHWINRNLELLA